MKTKRAGTSSASIEIKADDYGQIFHARSTTEKDLLCSNDGERAGGGEIRKERGGERTDDGETG